MLCKIQHSKQILCFVFSKNLTFFVLVSVPIQLKGLDFVAWKPLAWQRSLKANDVAMMFKTIEPSGVLLFIGNETKYLIIELFRGRLMVGTQMDTSKSSRHHSEQV